MKISNLDRDGEVRQFAGHGQAVISSVGAMALARAVFEPGWQWSVDVAPLAGTRSCQTRHLGYMIEGTMAVRMDDGTEGKLGPGDLFDIDPGHDAWVLGNRRCVMVDVSPEATRYAAGPTRTTIDPNVALVSKGYAAFNAGDFRGLAHLMSTDVMVHVPGTSSIAGEYKGIDAVLAYYGQIGDLTDGTFRAHPLEIHGDGRGQVVAFHQVTATRGGRTRVARGSIVFTVLDGKIADMFEMRADLAGDDAFFA